MQKKSCNLEKKEYKQVFDDLNNWGQARWEYDERWWLSLSAGRSTS